MNKIKKILIIEDNLEYMNELEEFKVIMPELLLREIRKIEQGHSFKMGKNNRNDDEFNFIWLYFKKMDIFLIYKGVMYEERNEKQKISFKDNYSTVS